MGRARRLVGGLCFVFFFFWVREIQKSGKKTKNAEASGGGGHGVVWGEGWEADVVRGVVCVCCGCMLCVQGCFKGVRGEQVERSVREVLCRCVEGIRRDPEEQT